MPRTAEKVETLAEEGEHLTDALGSVLEVAEEKGQVTWSDVSDDISSGEWGRLIETGLLVDVDGEGFVVDDPEGIREALEEADPSAMTEDHDTSWTTYDKAAGLVVVGLFVGYWLPSARQSIAGTIDVVFGPLANVMPFHVVILVLAVLTGLFSSVMQDNLANPEVMSEYREQSERLKERREKAKERGDDEELERIQQEQMEMMTDNLGVFKMQFRPMVWIMMLTIPVFLWMLWMVLDVGVAENSTAIVIPIIGEVDSWTQTIVGPIQVWLLWYFLCSLGFSQIMRKALNVQTSPT